jgi:uncharacterized protein
MNTFTVLDWIALVLVVIGGINWGLVGIMNLDLVATLFGDMSTLSRIVYGIILNERSAQITRSSPLCL